MKRKEYSEFQNYPDDERRQVFQAAGQRLNILGSNVEKDYWVCQVLDVLMKEAPYRPKCYFKGGTSLSKGFDLIKRFSEDVDLVLSRQGLKPDGDKFIGDDDPTNPHSSLSNKKRKKRVEELKQASSKAVREVITPKLQRYLPECEIYVSEEEGEGQTIFVDYPTLFLGSKNDYVLKRVKVECGARGALEPERRNCKIVPYIQNEIAHLWDLTICGVSMIAPERTFLEKLSAIHSLNCRFRDQGIAPADRQRVTRHYYDLAVMRNSKYASDAIKAVNLLNNVREHNKLVFPSAWAKHDEFKPGTILVLPPEGMLSALEKDYSDMQGMMYDNPPTFEWILEQLSGIDNSINQVQGFLQL